jgi:hypothetical protein
VGEWLCVAEPEAEGQCLPLGDAVGEALPVALPEGEKTAGKEPVAVTVALPVALEEERTTGKEPVAVTVALPVALPETEVRWLLVVVPEGEKDAVAQGEGVRVLMAVPELVKVELPVGDAVRDTTEAWGHTVALCERVKVAVTEALVQRVAVKKPVAVEQVVVVAVAEPVREKLAE